MTHYLPTNFPIATLFVMTFAYIGPGPGLSAIGALFALIAAVFLAIVGFIWYPIKRLFRRRKAAHAKDEKSDL